MNVESLINALLKKALKLDDQIAMATDLVLPCHNKELGLSTGISLMASFSVARKAPEV